MYKFLDKLICNNKEKFSAKLERIKNKGKEKLHLVLDFDRTLTPSRNEKGNEIATWKLLNRRLPPRFKVVATKLYEKYRPLEVAGKMTTADAAAWWSSCLDLYKQSGLKWADLALEVQETIPARPGAKELFDTCQKKGIPTIIISAGIKDVIELWCQKFEIKPTLVLSTNLRFDADGYVCGWYKNSLIHIFNKREKGHQELNAIRQARPNVILIGDSLDDAAMVDGKDDVLRFFIDDQRKDDARSRAFHDTIFKSFDLIVQNKSLLPLVEIINAIR